MNWNSHRTGNPVVRLTVLSADLPRGEEALAPGKQDHTDRIGVVEFRVFG